MFGKHFSTMYTGSMVGSGPYVFSVMGYVIANTRDSFVELNPAILSATIGDGKGGSAPVGEIKHAIKYLCLPDAESRTKEFEGARLVHQGGFLYFVVSYEKYRNMRSAQDRTEYMRTYMEKYRAGQKGQPSGGHVNTEMFTDVYCKPSLAKEEADTEADIKKKPKKPDAPKRAGPAKGKSESITFETFKAECAAKGEQLIPADSAVMRYAEDVGIPDTFLRLAWREFTRKYGEGQKKQKGVRGWRQAFDNSVRGNWSKLWYFEGDECKLTTAGKQADREAKRRA